MSKVKILIIDDEKVVHTTVERCLKKEGYELFYAEDGNQGLSLVKELSPKIIILDLMMPGMDGAAFLTELNLKRSDPYWVIVLTGHGSDDSVEQCYNRGVRNFVRKPFNFHELRGAVKSTIMLKYYSIRLEDKVKERTAELQEKLEDIQIFNTAAVGRELRIIEMKSKINTLCEKLGLDPEYDMTGLE